VCQLPEKLIDIAPPNDIHERPTGAPTTGWSRSEIMGGIESEIPSMRNRLDNASVAQSLDGAPV
jgi:hypothetical protein